MTNFCWRCTNDMTILFITAGNISHGYSHWHHAHPHRCEACIARFTTSTSSKKQTNTSGNRAIRLCHVLTERLLMQSTVPARRNNLITACGLSSKAHRPNQVSTSKGAKSKE